MRCTLNISSRQTRAVLFGQRQERDGLAGALGYGFEFLAEPGDELFRNQRSDHRHDQFLIAPV